MKFPKFRFKISRSSGTTERTPDKEVLSVWPWDADKVCTNPMKVATVFRCVKAISEGVAVLPLHLYRRSPDGIRRRVDGSLAYLLNVAPNPNQNAFDFKRQAIQQLLCTGNAYIVPVFKAPGYAAGSSPIVRDIESLWLLSPGSCGLDPVNMVYHVHDTVNGIHGEFRPEDIIHIKGQSRDGRTGVGVLEYASLTVGIATSGDKETKDRFTNGGNVRGFFTNSAPTAPGYNPSTDKFLEKLSEKNEAHFRLGGRISYLPGSVQFKELMLSSADMQFLESRKFTTREICFFFSVNPSYIGASDTSNYKDAENASLGFLQSALSPILIQLETELRMKLLMRPEAAEMEFRFDRNEIFALDLMTKASWMEKQLQMGAATVNEIRAMSDREPVEEGDTPLVSANLKPLGQLITENQNTPKNGETD